VLVRYLGQRVEPGSQAPRENNALHAQIITQGSGSAPVALLRPAAEKLPAWLEKGWPSKNEYGLPEGIRVFVLSPEDIAYIAAEKLIETDAGDLIHGVRKRLEWGLEDWSELVWNQIYRDDLIEDC
jgi:hypothetical protein